MLTGTTTLGAPAASAAVSWGPVHTLYRHVLHQDALVTTDNGMSVAAWSSENSRSLLLAVRRGPAGWSKPTVVLPKGAAVTFQLVKDGASAVAIAQGGTSVSVVTISESGRIQEPQVIGPSTHSFVNGSDVGIGPAGTAAAVWHPTTAPSDLLLSMRSSDGAWSDPEPVEGVRGFPAGVILEADGTVGIPFTYAGAGIGVYFVERSPDGVWGAPELVGRHAQHLTMEADRSGDMVVAYDVADAGALDDQGAKAFLRYRPAGQGFTPPKRVPGKATIYTETPLGMADDGTAVATYPDDSGGAAKLIRADVGGNWSSPQDLPFIYAGVVETAKGDLLLHHGEAFIVCPSGQQCGEPESDEAVDGGTAVFGLGPRQVVTVLWKDGCRGSECTADILKTNRGR